MSRETFLDAAGGAYDEAIHLTVGSDAAGKWFVGCDARGAQQGEGQKRARKKERPHA